MRRFLAVAGGLGPLAWAAACSSFSASPVAPNDAGDAVAEEASTIPPPVLGADLAADSGILFNGDFEQAGDCTGWKSENASVVGSALGLDGGGACVVCGDENTDDSGGYWAYEQVTVPDLAAGDEYQAEVSIAAPSNTPSKQAQLSVYLWGDAGATSSGDETSVIDLTPSFHPFSLPVTFEVTLGNSIYFAAEGRGRGTCILVDRASLRLIKKGQSP